MKLPLSVLSAALLPAVLSGCFSLGETPYPRTEMTRPAGTAAPTVAVRGFEADVAEYVTVSGVSTVCVNGWGDPWGGGWYGPGCWQTVPVSATVARPRPTDAFRERAQERFEQAGWLVKAQTPQYLVEVRFLGAETSGFWSRALRVAGTLFFSDRATMTCRAKLKVYDNRSGRLLLTREYAETLDESMWSPILVFGPLSYEKTTFDYMRLRCLSALTDRASSDASAFLAARPSPSGS